MQVTHGPMGLHREFFTARDKTEIRQKMNDRLNELQAEGHTLVKRTKIGRNTTCPCGSGRKFKKCCINKLR